MHSQFKRAIGVELLGVMQHISNLKKKNLLHTCYTAKTNNSQHRWNPKQTGRSVGIGMQSIHHTSPGYGIFEQFRNGYEYSMP